MVENGKETIVNIDDEIPFDIPESWAWCRFEDLGFFMGGHTPSMKEEENWNGDIVWVSPKDMKSTIISNSILKISKKGAEKLEKIPINAILMVVRSGILRHSFPIAIAHVSCTINQDIKAFSSFLSESTLYIYNSLCSFESYIINNFTKEGTTVNSIEWDNLKRIPLPIPPLLEQKKIVAKIHESLALLKELDVNLTKTKQIILDIKSKLLDLAIRGKLLPQDENDEPASELLKHIREEKESAQLTSKGKRKTAESYIFKGEDNLYYEKIGNSVDLIDDELPCKLPDNWQWAQFSDICDLYTGNSISKEVKAKKYTNLNNGYNYIGTKDVGFDNQINYNNGVKIPFAEMGFKIAPKNAVLLCIEGGSAGRKIGVTREDVCFGNKLCCFYSKTICNEFIYIYLQSPLFKKLFKESLMGLIGGVGTGSLEKIYVPIPPINEQKRISNFLDKAFEQLDSLIQH